MAIDKIIEIDTMEELETVRSRIKKIVQVLKISYTLFDILDSAWIAFKIAGRQ